jgi:hypothetical protein
MLSRANLHQSFSYGLGDGLLDIIAKPTQGAKRNGTLGFATGCAKGLGNAVLKPAAGEYLNLSRECSMLI